MSAESGSALVYILIAIALLAILTISFMQPSSQQTQSQNTFRLVSELQSQVEFIRSAAQECVLSHQKIDPAPAAGGSDPNAKPRYPIKPNSTYFTGATPGPTAGRLAKDIRCPGTMMEDSNAGNDKDHPKIFTGATGKLVPPPPDLFGDWQWYNGTDGVFMWIETDKTDAFIRTALTKLDDNYAECEADVVDAPTGGGDIDLDLAGTVVCPEGSLCFRFWIIAAPGNVYNGDADTDEVGCP